MGPGNPQASAETGSGDSGRKSLFQRQHQMEGMGKRGSVGLGCEAVESPRALEREDEKAKGKPLFDPIVLFLLLLTFTYLIFQSNTTAGRQAQDFVTQVMERDFNFAGVSQWYERQFAGSPSILPVFKPKSEKDSRKTSSWSVPVQGDVIVPFQP